MIPQPLASAVFGIYSTHSLHIADRAGVFDALVRRGNASGAALADLLKVEPDTLERLLLVLSAQGVLERAGDAYRLPDEMRPYLDRNDQQCLLGFVDHVVSGTAEQFGKLEAYLREGKAAVDGRGPTPFETIYRDDESVQRFMTAMWQLSHHVSHELATLAELHEVAHVVDVGGANGPFSVAALLAYPRLRATVFDLPQVEPHLTATREQYQLGDRLDFVGGDFFQDPIPEGDCVAFGYILSDWDDNTCAQLLSKAYDACRPDGRVLIMDRLFDDDGTGPTATAVMNLSMHFETQGRHRTAGAYRDLLTKAGFARHSVRRSSGDKHLIIGWRG